MTDELRLSNARALARTSGRSQEHLKFALDYLDQREAELTDAKREIEFLASHNGVIQIRELEEERARLLAEIERMRGIYDLAIEWRTAIHNLEASRKKGEGKKGGEGVYKSNQAYTKAHVALKTALEPDITQS